VTAATGGVAHAALGCAEHQPAAAAEPAGAVASENTQHRMFTEEDTEDCDDHHDGQEHHGAAAALPVRKRSRKPHHPTAATGEPLPLLHELPTAPPSRTAAAPAQRPHRVSLRSDAAPAAGDDDADDLDYHPRRSSSHARGSHHGPKQHQHQPQQQHQAAATAAAATATSPRNARVPASIGSRLLSQRAVASKAANGAAPAGTSGFFGVSWSKNKQRWDACFRACDVKLFRRNYHTAEEAARAWDLAAREC